MKNIVSALLATAVAVSIVATSFVAADAAPIVRTQPLVVQNSDLIQVQDFRRHRGPGVNRIYRGQRDGYYRGYRGYREYRQGYRRHGDRWFPAAAFAGALITGAIINSQQPRVRVGIGTSHVQYCYDRYKSYRASDNTFQPYNGPRQQCL